LQSTRLDNWALNTIQAQKKVIWTVWNVFQKSLLKFRTIIIYTSLYNIIILVWQVYVCTSTQAGHSLTEACTKALKPPVKKKSPEANFSIGQRVDYFSVNIPYLKLYSYTAVELVRCTGQARIVSANSHFNLVEDTLVVITVLDQCFRCLLN